MVPAEVAVNGWRNWDCLNPSCKAVKPVCEVVGRVVHCKREPFDVYIGRATDELAGLWGNPFKIGRDGDRAEVIEKYRRWIVQQPELMTRLPELRGKVLGCYCAPLACHGDVLLELANREVTA